MTCRFIDHFTMKIFQISPAQPHDTLNLSDNSQKNPDRRNQYNQNEGYHIFGMYFSASVPLFLQTLEDPPGQKFDKLF